MTSTDALFRLDGRRVLIVGGYGGIGRVVSEFFADAGAKIAIAGRSLEKAEALAEELRAKGGEAVGASIDLTERTSAYEAVDRVGQEFGGLDVLVNSAGIDIQAAATDMQEDQWRTVLRTNLGGAFWLSQATAVSMIAAGGGGSIVHFSSTRGAIGGRRGFAAYGASKAGLDLLVKQLATEWGQHAITVNAVAPGFVPTELVASSSDEPPFMEMMRNRVPFGRFGTPEEMASVALFLASPAASFVSGQIIYVDGGVMASS